MPGPGPNPFADLATRPIIGVIGGSRCTETVGQLAEAVGRAIATAGATLICGGLTGVMEAACRGAAEAGGLTIGVLPGADRDAANRWVALPVVTGLSEARNAIIVRTAHALIAIDGNSGTLNEIAYAMNFGVPVVGLQTWRIQHPDAPDDDPIQRATTPEEAVGLALALSRTPADRA